MTDSVQPTKPEVIQDLKDRLSKLKPDELKDVLATVDRSENGYLRDQRGGKSSKRFWAFAFGWTTIIQALALIALVVAATALNLQVSETAIPLLEYSLASTGVLTALCLGLTVPEWFAPKK